VAGVVARVMKEREVDRATFNGVLELVAEHPELTVERLRQLVEESGKRPAGRAEKIRPRTALELAELVKCGVLNRAEAKRFVAIPKPPRPRPKP